MGKRSPGQFERKPRDLYDTWDPRAVRPLLTHLSPHTRFVEPCAGRGALIDQLEAAGHVCVFASDIEPLRPGVAQLDATTADFPAAETFITNPPWDRKLLHPLIVNLSDQAPTWLLFDADWKHTLQAIPYLPRLRRIVSVGRVRWEQGSKYDGKDNCAWYLFGRPQHMAAQFFGRTNNNSSAAAVAYA